MKISTIIQAAKTAIASFRRALEQSAKDVGDYSLEYVSRFILLSNTRSAIIVTQAEGGDHEAAIAQISKEAGEARAQILAEATTAIRGLAEKIVVAINGADLPEGDESLTELFARFTAEISRVGAEAYSNARRLQPALMQVLDEDARREVGVFNAWHPKKVAQLAASLRAAIAAFQVSMNRLIDDPADMDQINMDMDGEHAMAAIDAVLSEREKLLDCVRGISKEILPPK